jgi:hypothetical protein
MSMLRHGVCGCRLLPAERGGSAEDGNVTSTEWGTSGLRDGELGNDLGDLYHFAHSYLWYRYEQSKRLYASTSVYVIRVFILLSGLVSCVDSQYVRTSNRQYWGAETDEHSVDYQSIA